MSYRKNHNPAVNPLSFRTDRRESGLLPMGIKKAPADEAGAFLGAVETNHFCAVGFGFDGFFKVVDSAEWSGRAEVLHHELGRFFGGLMLA